MTTEKTPGRQPNETGKKKKKENLVSGLCELKAYCQTAELSHSELIVSSATVLHPVMCLLSMSVCVGGGGEAMERC